MTEDARTDLRIGLPVNRGVLIAALAGVLVLTLLGPLLVYSDQPMVGEGNGLRQGVYGAIFLAVLYAVRPTEWRRLIAIPIPILVAIAWCWLSLSWSIDPGISFRRLALTTIVMWVIFVGVRQLGYDLTVNMLRIALSIVLVVNFVAVLLFPDWAIHQLNTVGDKDLVGSWRGVMMHKNFAGEVSALLIPLLIFDGRKKLVWLRVAGVIAATIFLYFSHSKTSLGLIGLGVLAGYGYERLSVGRRAFAIPVLILLGVAVALLNDLYHDPLHQLLRDPEAITGRSQIWRALLAYIDDHPWLGSGYGSFWNIGPASPIYKYSKGWVTDLANGHNGFIDLTVQLGIPGAILVVAAAIFYPLFQLFSDGRLAVQRAAIVIAIIVFSFAHNATESSLFDRDVIVQVFLMFAIALIGPLKDEADRADRRSRTVWGTSGMRHALS